MRCEKNKDRPKKWLGYFTSDLSRMMKKLTAKRSVTDGLKFEMAQEVRLTKRWNETDLIYIVLVVVWCTCTQMNMHLNYRIFTPDLDLACSYRAFWQTDSWNANTSRWYLDHKSGFIRANQVYFPGQRTLPSASQQRVSRLQPTWDMDIITQAKQRARKRRSVGCDARAEETKWGERSLKHDK